MQAVIILLVPNSIPALSLKVGNTERKRHDAVLNLATNLCQYTTEVLVYACLMN